MGSRVQQLRHRPVAHPLPLRAVLPRLRDHLPVSFFSTSEYGSPMPLLARFHVSSARWPSPPPPLAVLKFLLRPSARPGHSLERILIGRILIGLGFDTIRILAGSNNCIGPGVFLPLWEIQSANQTRCPFPFVRELCNDVFGSCKRRRERGLLYTS